MKKLLVCFLIMSAVIYGSRSVQAAGAYGHFIISDQEIGAINSGNQDAPKELKDILNDPDCQKAFRGGAIAPDLCPESSHYGDTGDLARKMLSTAQNDLKAAVEKGDQDAINQAKKELAFSYGWLSHCSADLNIHPVVNAATGDNYDNGGYLGQAIHAGQEVQLDAYLYKNFKKSDNTYSVPYEFLSRFVKESPKVLENNANSLDLKVLGEQAWKECVLLGDDTLKAAWDGVVKGSFSDFSNFASKPTEFKNWDLDDGKISTAEFAALRKKIMADNGGKLPDDWGENYLKYYAQNKDKLGYNPDAGSMDELRALAYELQMDSLKGMPKDFWDEIEYEKNQYEFGVKALANCRNKDATAWFKPSWEGTDWQLIPSAEICAEFFENRDNRVADAWYIFQEASWREELPKRKKALDDIIASVKKKFANQPKSISPEPAAKKLIEAASPIRQAVGDIFGKDACLIARDDTGNFFAVSNSGKRVSLSGKLQDTFKVSNEFAVLGNDDILKASAGFKSWGGASDTINGGVDTSLGKTSPELKDRDYMRITDKGMEIFSPASSVMVDSKGLLASSEHSSIRGTINGGGDFVKNGSPPRLIQTPSAEILMYGTRVAVDVGFNGATAVLVLEGKVKAKELVTGSEVEVNEGQVAVIIPGFAVGVALAVDKVNRWWEKENIKPSAPSSEQTKASGDIQLNTTQIAEKSLPATVVVESPDVGQGSGVLVDEKGTVLTCFHVLDGAKSASIKLSNGAYYPVKGFLGFNRGLDVAVVKIDGKNLPYLPIGDSDAVKPGDKLVAIGSPKGLENTISEGIVSAIRRVSEFPEDWKKWLIDSGHSEQDVLIQFTAPITHGSSGGPLINSAGEVIGVVILRDPRFDADNIYFAIPANTAKQYLNTQTIQKLEEVNIASIGNRELHTTPAGYKTFQEGSFGYTINYPSDWVYTKPSQYTVVFSGKEGMDAYYSTVSIQNIASSKAGGKHENVDSLAKSLKDQITTGAENGKISDEKAFDCSADGEKLTAKGFKAEYARQGENFKQWVVVVQRADGKAFHVWSYTSPAAQYDTFLGTAQAILDSWAITK